MICYIYDTINVYLKIPDTDLDYGGVLTKRQPVANPEKIQQQLALIGHKTFRVRSNVITLIK